MREEILPSKNLSEAKYKIAGAVFSAQFKYDYCRGLFSPFLYTGEDKPLFYIDTNDSDIQKEMEICETKSIYYCEGVLAHRKVCERLLELELAFPLHCSAVAVDGEAYLFTADSGVGKSTHTSLWKEFFMDRAVIVNDDKPFIGFIEGKAYVYGSPWNGKHDLGCNIKAPIKAICHLNRGKNNSIIKLDSFSMLKVLLSQTVRYESKAHTEKVIDYLTKLVSIVPSYKLNCDISKEAVEVSYKAMSGE